MSQFGEFSDFCRDSTIPVCNLFINGINAPAKSCYLVGFTAGGNQVGNLGVVVLAGIAIIASIVLLLMAEKKAAAVGRREMQILLLGYILVSFAEIFTVGEFLTSQSTLKWFTGIHIGAITATFWVLLLNAIVGYQLLDDGTALSILLVGGSMVAVFLGTGYIAMDTAREWTDTFVTLESEGYRNYALYILYLLFPIISVAAYFTLESVLVLRVLGEKRPMILLCGAVLLFVIGQVFDFAISVHICNATSGKIDGSLFQTLFTLLSVVTLWYFWSSITEDVWIDEPPSLMEETTYGP